MAGIISLPYAGAAPKLVDSSFGKKNKKPLIDLVKLGKEAFTGKGCAECHTVDADGRAIKTGPGLYALFQKKPIQHKVIDGNEKHLTTLRANAGYFSSSVRLPNEHLARQSKGDDQGKPYLPIMPAYSEKMLSKVEEKAIFAYLKTLNAPANAGPSEVLVKDLKKVSYNADTDSQSINTYDATKVYRSFIDNGASARGVHVGLANGQNYTFDPQTLAIERVWTGRFLDLRNEIKGRGGKPNKVGHQATAWGELYAGILQPLTDDGVPFTDDVTNAIPSDFKTSQSAYTDDLAKVSGQFLGYTRAEVPVMKYNLQGSEVSLSFHITPEGEFHAKVAGELKQPLVLKFPADVLSGVKVSSGDLDEKKGLWKITNLKEAVTWSAVPKEVRKISQKKQPAVAVASPFSWQVGESEEDITEGFKITSAKGPQYSTGEYPLFEPTAIDFDSKGQPVIGSRSAGIWKIIDQKWQPYALGTFEVLGLHVREDDALIVAQKPEISLIKDTNNDGSAETYQTLADDFRFIGNYHSYNHGPAVDSKGNIHFNLNLQHFNGENIFKAKGKYMGTTGGLRGWSCQITPDGEFVPYAYGLRSSAGIAFSPDDKLYYTDNQGEYMSTSKLFRIKKGAFYGHPGAMIDLPNMTEKKVLSSVPEVLERRETPAILMPHGHVANSPGHPVWDTTAGKFGPFAGQVFIGDQTLSNIHRVYLETVNGVEQGSIMPFVTKLPSGPMRLTFSPSGEMWVGQTGRGWASRGGNVSALQKITWKGGRTQALHRVEVRGDGFEIYFTQPIPETQRSTYTKTKIKSWYYLDAYNYGSKELGKRDEKIQKVEWNEEGDGLYVTLANFGEHKDKSKNAGFTSRVYQILLEDTSFGKGRSNFHTKAYYTLNEVPNQ